MVEEPIEASEPVRLTDGQREARFIVSLAALFLLALGARLAYLWQFRRSPFFGVLLGDCIRYDAWARSIAAGDWLGGEVFFQAPLYPYFLAAVYRLIADDPVTVMLMQIVLGATSCVLLALAARDLLGRRAALACGALLALYPPALFFEHILQKSALDLFFVCLMLWLLARAVGRGWNRWLAAGLAAGGLTLTRENALLLVVCIVAWILVERLPEAATLRQRATIAAAFLAGVALVLLPVALRNVAVGGEWVLTSSQAGRNLYYGNNPTADGAYRPLRPGRADIRFEAQDARELAEEALGRRLSAREVSRYWAGRSLAWVRDHPGDWLRLMARKLLLLVNRVEIMDTEDQYTHREHVPLARALGAVLHFGTLLPLATAGILLTWSDPQAHRRRLLMLLIAGYAASVWIFFVLDRYRHPLVPMLALFAGAGLARLPDLGRIPRRRLAWIACAVVATTVVANLPGRSIQRMRALSYSNLAAHLGERGRLDEAILHLRTSLSLVPNDASARFNLGLFLARRGALDAAETELRRAAELDPGHRKAAAELARTLARGGRLDEAAAAFESALELDPENASLFDGLGVVHARRGQFAAAEDAFARALELDPGRESAIRNLERARAERKAVSEAVAQGSTESRP